MKYVQKLPFIFIFFIGLSPCLHAQDRLELSNKKASKEARALYSYIQDMYGKKVLSGQMLSNFGEHNEVKYVEEVTGKLPAIQGVDFIDSSKNEDVVKMAEAWWKKGGIPTIMWHWGAPGIGDGYINSKKEVDIDKCFEKGTPEYNAFWSELEERGKLLKKLKKAHVPVLWRPFHELNGDWFWWGKKGPDQFKRLWITMYDYYVHKLKLNNLVWVLCYSGKPDSAWYPGRNYVDLAGADTYGPNKTHLDMYKKMESIVGTKMPIPLHEIGIPPNPDSCFNDGAKWAWWMVWHTNFIRKVDKDYLKFVYNNDKVITLDKVPDIMAVYGKKENFFERLWPF